MIKFFRKIRQKMLTENKFSKYLIYAIGEIILVVIGILIALSLNNWNQNQNEQNKIKEYAVSLIQDLEADIRMTGQIQRQIEDIVFRIDSLNKYIYSRKIDDFSNLDMLFFTLNKPHRPYTWKRTTITELKNSGTFGLIKNDSLSKMISEYDAFTYHLDDDFINDRIQFEKATDLSTMVVNYNYPNLLEFRMKLLPSDNARHDDFFESQEYLVANSINLELITKDINQIQEMANTYSVLMLYLRIRTDDELPKLTNNAAEIIALLKETYLD
jgi:hypothetical protein